MLLASVWFLFCSILKRVLKLSWFFSWYCIYCIYMRSTLGRSVSISYVSMKIVCIHVCFKQVYLSVRWVHVMNIFNRGETQGCGGGGGLGDFVCFVSYKFWFKCKISKILSTPPAPPPLPGMPWYAPTRSCEMIGHRDIILIDYKAHCKLTCTMPI